MKIKLTKKEVEILHHRATCPDEVAEAFGDSETNVFNLELIKEICDNFEVALRKILPRGGVLSFVGIKEEKWVLAELLEGSTWFAYGCDTSYVTEQVAACNAQIGERLAKKIGKAIGRPVDCPLC